MEQTNQKNFKYRYFEKHIIHFKLQIMICGLGCHHIDADCFWNIDGTENGDLLHGTENSGKGELTHFHSFLL